ncbi:MAG TPA: DUF4445 domain-containing protein [Nitrospirae bacterium]|nr:DUF4445 domain-containing protein [Nitrospirota bacterium]
MKLFLSSNEEIELTQGQDIYSALKKAGVFITSSCGGKGFCGKCKVNVLSGQYDAISYGKLTTKEREQRTVLACKTYPKDDILIEIPKLSRLVVGDKIAQEKSKDLYEYFKSFDSPIMPFVIRKSIKLPPPNISDNISDLERLNRTLNELGLTPIRYSHGFVLSMADILRMSNWEIDINYTNFPDGIREAIFITSKEYCHRRFGLAIDIGTTTIVVYLVDIIKGTVIDTGSTYNSQIRYGDDVITRIVHATEGDGLQELRDAVIEDINNIITAFKERHSIKVCELDSVVISGNTTMVHLFWGLTPAYIREEPYIPTVNRFPLWRASFARLSVNQQAPVYTMPCVASYVGGDIVSGVLATKMHRRAEIALFMDIGTNGEVAIGNNEWLMTAACSAGPCFEGSGISSGMRAIQGAIESVTFDIKSLEPTLKVIGDVTPLGICGSGMIDALAGMFITGLINQKGKFIPEKSKRIRIGQEGYEYVFYYDSAGGRDIVLTEVDIDNLIRAKAAIYAGIMTILNEIGLAIDAIQTVYIAGGFGSYIDIKKAIIIGMLPDIEIERYRFMGNTSATGAYLCLLSTNLIKEAEEIASKMTYLELSVMKGFMDDYVSALFLPHTDITKFPTVQKEMNNIIS